jgi:DNA-binding transcriptional LysR family regulator
MDRLALLHAFVEVVDCGSFSQAALASGASQPAISKRVAQLERSAGTRLLMRSTRRVLPTDEGRVLYERARRVLDAAAGLLEGIGARRGGRICGRVRVLVGPSFSRTQLLTRLPRLLARHPGLQIELADDAGLPLSEQGAGRFDLALRCQAAPAHSGCDSRQIARVHQVLVATPAYLQRRGTPRAPEELLRHDCVVNLGSASSDQWTLMRAPAQPITLRVDGRMRVANSELMRSAVLEGLGIALAPAWLFAQELQAGSVVALLAEHVPPPQAIHAWVPRPLAASERVQTLLAFLDGEFAVDAFLSGAGS